MDGVAPIQDAHALLDPHQLVIEGGFLQPLAGQGLAGLNGPAIKGKGEAQLTAVVAVLAVAAGEHLRFEEVRRDVEHRTIAEVTAIKALGRERDTVELIGLIGCTRADAGHGPGFNGGAAFSQSWGVAAQDHCEKTESVLVVASMSIVRVMSSVSTIPASREIISNCHGLLVSTI